MLNVQVAIIESAITKYFENLFIIFPLHFMVFAKLKLAAETIFNDKDLFLDDKNIGLA